MPRKLKEKKDRTSLLIALAMHVILILGIGYWAWKTGRLEEFARRALEFVRTEKKETAKQETKPLQHKTQPPPKLPPINQGLPPSGSSGTRRAVASAAPAASGETFFVDTRTQTSGPSQGAAGAASKTTNAPQTKVERPHPIIPRPLIPTAPPSTIKQLLVERSKASASIESFGSEQIAKSGVSDAGAIVNKIAGATIVQGKFAVVRGLSDRYVSTTLNGAKLPSADPYRQSVPLDLFPAQVIDKVVVTKTFTPDQPGTSTGGGIDVVTKSFPEKDFLSLSLGGEYNTQASLNRRFLTYNGGGLDWAGMDDGTRALPPAFNGGVPNGVASFYQSGAPTSSAYNQKVAAAYRVDELTRTLGTTQFAPQREESPLNHNFAAAGGGSTHLFTAPLGYFASVSYKHDYSFYENGLSQRYWDGTILKTRYRDSESLSVVNWSGMVNLAYDLFPNQELGFTFFYNQNGTDESGIQDQGYENYSEGNFRKFRLYWTERNLNTFQIKGKHSFPEAGDIRFDWLVALTETTQDEPDARFFNDFDQGGGPYTGGNTVPTPSDPTRYFRNLEENDHNVKLDWTVPFRTWSVEDGKFKFGLFESQSERSFVDHAIRYPEGGLYGGDPNLFLTPDNLGLDHLQTNKNGSLNFYFNRYVQSYDSLYNGNLGVQAGYLMTELPLTERLRLVGGVRYEATDYSVHSKSYLASSVTGLRINDTGLKQADLLPSAGLIYAVNSNMNVRLSCSQTIARPSFRELAAYRSWDPLIQDNIEGNPLLKMTSIDNYDVRWEWFPRPGELFSVSLFYKELKNAIERGDVKVDAEVITFLNRASSKIYGAEFEARKNLDFLDPVLSDFSLGGNLSLIQSEVSLTANELSAKSRFFPNVSHSRPLYDQSPYIVNLDLSYNNPSAGTTAALICNIAGPRIAITKLNADDVYEQPAPSLDFIISQRIGRHTTVKFSAKNLLDPKIERTYGRNSSLLYSSYTRGLRFGLSMNYEF